MIIRFNKKIPMIDSTSFIFESATLIGNVNIGKNVGVFPGAVIRGDENSIEIGDNSNIQDNCVLHVSKNHSLKIGKGVSIGHNATIHGCKISDNCIIGMGTIILNGAKIGKNCIIGAGALVTENTIIPNNCIAIGVPAKVMRKAKAKDIDTIEDNWRDYVRLLKGYKS